MVTGEWIESPDHWERCRVDGDQFIAETWAYGDSMTGSHIVQFDLTPEFVAALRSQLDMWEQAANAEQEATQRAQ